MNRRTFVRSAALASAALVLPGGGAGAGACADAPAWRAFDITPRVDVANPRGRVRVWVPVPLVVATSYQRSGATTIDAGQGTAKIVKDARRGFACVTA